MINSLISSFNAGELSPYLEHRTNLEKYRNGCLVLQNYIPTTYGSVHRRAGTEYLGDAYTSSTRCRLFGLNFSDSDRVMVELGVGYMRFWRDGQVIMNNGSQAFASTIDYAGNALSSVPSNFWYTESELRDVSFLQINRVIYMTHPNHPPMRLSYYSDSNITFGEVSFKFAPMGDVNIGAGTITPSATSGTITLTASLDTFVPGDVGSYMQLNHFNPTKQIQQSLKVNGTSAAVYVLGGYILNTFGTWVGQLDIQQLGLDGVWYTIKSFTSNSDYNASYTATAATRVQLRLVSSGTSSVSSTTAPRAILTPLDSMMQGQVRITGYTNARSVTGIVTQSLGDTAATGMWYKGAFSSTNGYPSGVGLYEGRVFFGGTTSQPNTLWGSASNDFQQFLLGASDSDAVSFTLSSVTAGRIQWMVGKSSLIVGTTTDEWAIQGSNGNPLTASNVSAKLQSRYGSASMLPLVVNETLLFFQRGNRKVREMSYNWGVDAWVSPDVTILAEQVMRDGVYERAYTRVPDGSMWLVTGAGNLVNMIYERDQQIASFSRHNTDGIVESVSVLVGNGVEDEVWLAVRRTIKDTNGNDIQKRYIERFRLGVRTATETGNKSGWWFSDCAKQIANNSPTNVITGLDHLEGKTVQVWADNAMSSVAPNPNTGKYTVKNGTIYLTESVSTAIVGLAYTSILAPMRCQQDLQDGTSVGRRARVNKIKVGVMNSIGGEFSSDNSTWFQMNARVSSDRMDQSPAPLNGFEVLTIGGNWSYNPNIYLRQTLPMPLSILSIVVLWEASENIQA